MFNDRMDFDGMMATLREEVGRFQRPVSTGIGEKEDPYKVLISCIISLRTKDAVTEKASEALFKAAGTPEKMVELGEERIGELIYPAGFYRTKAKTIRDISKKLVEEYNSNVPESMEELMKFKGVGRKTAGITMLYGFGKVVAIPTDTHVHRISNRLGLVKTKAPEETEQELMKVLPKKYWYDYNWLLVAWGQNVCKPVIPMCSVCKIRRFCKRVGVTKSA
jgi:endonuclease-3